MPPWILSNPHFLIKAFVKIDKAEVESNLFREAIQESTAASPYICLTRVSFKLKLIFPQCNVYGICNCSNLFQTAR